MNTIGKDFRESRVQKTYDSFGSSLGVTQFSLVRSADSSKALKYF